LPMIDKNTFKKPLEYSGDKITLCLKKCPTVTLVTAKGTCKLFFSDPEVTKYPAALVDDICADSAVANFGMNSGTYFNDTYNRCIPSSFDINKELSDVLPDMQNYEQPNLSNISTAVSGIENFLELYHYSWYHTVANDLRTCFFPDLILIILISTGFTLALFHLLMFASSCCGGSKTCQAAYWLNYIIFLAVGIAVIVYTWIKYSQSTSNRVVLRDLGIILIFVVLSGAVTGLFAYRTLLNFVMRLMDEARSFILSEYWKFVFAIPVTTMAFFAVHMAIWGEIMRYCTSVFKDTSYHARVDTTRSKDYLIVMASFMFMVMYVTTHMVFYCQGFVVSVATSIWYFTRMTGKVKYTNYPVKTGTSWLWNFHGGTMFLGSFTLAIFNPFRAIFGLFQSKMRAGGVCAQKCSCCSTCRQCFDAFMLYLSDFNFIQTAINSAGFFDGGEDLILLFTQAGIQPGCLTSVSWSFFLAKLTLTLSIIPISINFLYFGRTDLFLPGGPIVLSIMIAWLIAEIWIGMLKTIMATVFICCLEDMKINNCLHDKSGSSANLDLFCSSELRNCVIKLREIGTNLTVEGERRGSMMMGRASSQSGRASRVGRGSRVSKMRRPSMADYDDPYFN